MPSQSWAISGQCKHLFGFRLGNDTGTLIVSLVALLAEGVKKVDLVRRQAQRELQRPDDPQVMRRSGSFESRGGQRSRRKLKRRIVSNVEPPVRDEIRRLAGFEVTIGEPEQLRDLFARCSMRLDPP